MNRQQRSQVTSGVLLIVLGLVFLAAQSGWPIAAALNFGRLWPVLLLVLGLGRVLVPADDGPSGRIGGAWLILVAGVFLMNNYGVMPLSQSWPLFIVLAGASLLFGGGRRGTPKGAPRD